MTECAISRIIQKVRSKQGQRDTAFWRTIVCKEIWLAVAKTFWIDVVFPRASHYVDKMVQVKGTIRLSSWFLGTKDSPIIVQRVETPNGGSVVEGKTPETIVIVIAVGIVKSRIEK